MAKPTGTVYLCANAIIDNSYSNTVDFKTPNEQYSYWGSLVKYTVTDFMYIRRTRQYIKVEKSLNELEDINYMFFRSSENHKLYYCFVTGKEYINDNASYIYFDTDVLQTYMFDYELKESYVLQEHVDRWTPDHKPVYSRTDEGLEYGSEYTVESAYKIAPINATIQDSWYLAILKPGFSVRSGRASYSSRVVDGANPYVFLLLPGEKFITANIVSDYKLVGNIDDFQKIMANSDLGNFVVQILRLPYLPFDFKYRDTELSVDEGGQPVTYYRVLDVTGKKPGIDGQIFSTVNIGSDGDNTNFLVLNVYSAMENAQNQRFLADLGIFEGIESALPTDKQWEDLKTKPYNIPRDKRFESKLLCYPYRYNYLSDWKTTPIVFKNEYLTGDKITIKHTQGIGFNAPARYWVDGYKKDVTGRNNSLIQAGQEDTPVINDQYYTYMLQNRNQLQADRTNALVNATVGAVGGVVSGAVGGAMSGGGWGALAGAVMGGVGNAINGAVNYQNMVRSQNAKQQDLKNLPDNILSVNDVAFSLQDLNKYVTLYRMKICCEFEELLADTFAMTGYTVKRVKLPNLRSRVRYNYIKTIGANVVGSFNQDDLAKIRAIFDNGVTFWHYNEVNFKPYDYSLENIETSLI